MVAPDLLKEAGLVELDTQNSPLINSNSVCWERLSVSYWGRKRESGGGEGELKTFYERFRGKNQNKNC